MSVQTSRFSVGRIVKAPEVCRCISGAELLVFLCFHIQGYWGVVATDVKESNDQAINSGKAIISIYYSRCGCKCVISTSPERSYTTVTLG